MKHEAEAFINSYMKDHILPPTYQKIADALKIPRTTAYNISFEFIDRIGVNQVQPKKVKLRYYNFLFTLDRMDQDLNKLIKLLN